VTHHIVCRDCEFEALVDDSAEAGERAWYHAEETGHRVASDRIDGSARMETDGGRDTLRLTDEGIEIPDDVDFSEGVVLRARGATVDHKPGHTDREFYPMFKERHLTAEDRSVVNEELDEFEISIKPYGEDARTYEVTVPAADGGNLQKTDDEHTEEAPSDIVSVTTPEYAHGEIQTEWFTGEVDDRSGVRFSVEVHQDGPDIALSAGTASAEQEKRLYTYHALSPAKAERVGKALLEAADMAKAVDRAEREEQEEASDSLLQRLMGR